MHKKFVNHCTIDLSIIPDGPILIKSGDEGADPTKPNMEFVETYHAGGRTIYLPGSSLKGAIRAHAERIVRTVGSEERPPGNSQKLWASNPLQKDKYLEDIKEENKNNPNPNIGVSLYKQSSFTDQMFGNTFIASRIRIEDAYPDNSKPVKTEERNGVAIDRVFGSVAVGPFNYQVCTEGEFKTKLHLKNFTLAQLGLIGLVLRDLDDGWFGLGFAKSRGLGTVKIKLNKAIVQYPGCELKDGSIHIFGRKKEPWAVNSILGIGEFLEPKEAEKYNFPNSDKQYTEFAVTESMDFNFGVKLTWINDDKNSVIDLFEQTVKSWSQLLGVAK